MKLTIYVEPTGKGRPRATVIGGHASMYTPTKTRKAENDIRVQLATAGVYFDREVPISIDMTFFMARPKSAPKKRILPTVKPDWDNLGKLLTDAAEKYLYENDCQITTAVVRKRYTDHTPRIELSIHEDYGS